MNKAFVDKLIHNMKLADMVMKNSPWMMEGFGEKTMNTRFVGLKLKDEWLEIFSPADNLLLKFVIDRNAAYLEFYLANKPPFIKIYSTRFSESDKWEILLGELRRKLKKDKTDFINHNDQVANLYARLKPHLK